jgi:hypothetical protein
MSNSKKITELSFEELKEFFSMEELCLMEIFSNHETEGIVVDYSTFSLLSTTPNFKVHGDKIGHDQYLISKIGIKGNVYIRKELALVKAKDEKNHKKSKWHKK